ncbi:uncharacterized protein KY384_007336 [Bacidia gigantensis]|uniref:uncharacterized protein n=1 Tax=Bacidia gigantensis TaxID=2732470 RepID=UPI001D05AE6A|nr:uncharacterized protein KY384_007336 [Bacidia gigantensis]KAG8528418.1 hypothetical protein KY384_007336 [Bacidia gigantensis]
MERLPTELHVQIIGHLREETILNTCFDLLHFRLTSHYFGEVATPSLHQALHEWLGASECLPPWLDPTLDARPTITAILKSLHFFTQTIKVLPPRTQCWAFRYTAPKEPYTISRLQQEKRGTVERLVQKLLEYETFIEASAVVDLYKNRKIKWIDNCGRSEVMKKGYLRDTRVAAGIEYKAMFQDITLSMDCEKDLLIISTEEMNQRIAAEKAKNQRDEEGS